MVDFGKTVPVGTALFIVANGDLLMMRRKGGFGDGKWGLMGGKLEMGEKSFLGLAREVHEEIGVYVPWMQPVGWNDYFDEHDGQKTQWVTLFYVTSEWYGVPKVMEPNKHSELAWFPIDNLPKDMFEPLRLYISNSNNGVPNPTPGPRVQTMARCPYKMGFRNDFPCSGYLVRDRILDAERMVSTCIKCGRTFGVELITQHEAKAFNPRL